MKEDESESFKQKVMISLLTISCVYLGGTSALPIAEASMVDGQNVASGTKLSFADNHTINEGLNDGAGIRVLQNENITINAEGNLNILGSGKKSTKSIISPTFMPVLI